MKVKRTRSNRVVFYLSDGEKVRMEQNMKYKNWKSREDFIRNAVLNKNENRTKNCRCV